MTPSYTTDIVVLCQRDAQIIFGDFEHSGFNCDLGPVSTEGVMSKIFQSMAVSVFAFTGLVGCDYESRAAGDVNPARVAEMKKDFRDLWLGHIYWVQHAVLNSATSSRAPLATRYW